jgi:hypothetical protein
MTTTDFFATTSAVKQFIRGIDISTDITAFAPMYRHAAKKLVKLIGQDTYDMLAAHVKTPPTPAVAILDLAVEYVRGTLANLLAISWFTFDAGNRNKTDEKLYRYQETQIIEAYLENAWAEFDQLISLMEEDIAKAAADESVPPYVTPFADFEGMELFKERQNLYITSAGEFDKYYGIDNSSYFYFSAVFIQKEVEQENIYSRVKEKPTDEDLLWLIKKAIAFETVAIACKRFDYTELPKNIRNSIPAEIGSSVNRAEMGDIKEKQYVSLHNKAVEYLDKIELKMKLKDALITPEVSVQVNDETKKFYLST